MEQPAAIDMLERSLQTHQVPGATPELHIPAAVRETPEEKWVCAALCALEMQSRESVIPKSLAYRRNL